MSNNKYVTSENRETAKGCSVACQRGQDSVKARWCRLLGETARRLGLEGASRLK